MHTAVISLHIKRGGISRRLHLACGGIQPEVSPLLKGAISPIN